ncbi:NAD(P)-binding protein [Cadophora sp. DSE1049]|nr:NAD(P)-binding protein [Cadophora sp. DSE1049]
MSGLAALRAQRQTIPVPTQSFAGQTIIVTGSNTGLGLEAARHFVRLDAAKVILAVRSVKKGEDAKASIEQTTGKKNVVEVWQVDMSNYESVKAFAKNCGSLDRLDVLLANAGVLKNTFDSAEGTEITITVNVIGTFLLILSLLPLLRKSKQTTGMTPRVTVTSSILHEKSKFAERKEPSIFEAFKKNNQSYIDDRYNTSKLLEVLLVRSISAAMKQGPNASTPVILNTVNPGLCHSELDKDVEGMAGYFLTFAKALIARTTEVGGRTLVHSCAAGPESDGQYMSECKVKEPSPFVRSKEGAAAQERVHKELMAILEQIQPGITNNI